MIIDLYTKAILTAIAIVLVVIALNPWISPLNAQAQYEYDFGKIASDVRSIKSAVSSIEDGICLNSKICAKFEL